MINPAKRNESIGVILLANQPRMLRQMLHRVLDKMPEIQLILETDNPRQLPNILDRVAADWLIATLTPEGQLSDTVKEAIKCNPSMSVVGISADGDQIAVQRADSSGDYIKRQRYALENISLSELLIIFANDGNAA